MLCLAISCYPSISAFRAIQRTRSINWMTDKGNLLVHIIQTASKSVEVGNDRVAGERSRGESIRRDVMVIVVEKVHPSSRCELVSKIRDVFASETQAVAVAGIRNFYDNH